jgi:dipeptidyl aminopeptidase/acylaminoacyl peptidase
MTNRIRRTLILSALFLCGIAPVVGQVLTVAEIMAEPSIAGTRVENERLSPDGTKVIFLWQPEGKYPRDLYIVPTDGSAKPSILLKLSDFPATPPKVQAENKLDYGLTVRDEFVKERETSFGGMDWSPDSKKLLFSQAGDLYVYTLGEAKPKRYTKTQSGEAAARFVDNERILYQQNGNIFVLNIKDATTVQLTKDADPAKFIGVGNATVSKDGSIVAYVVSDSSKQKALVVPNYLGEFVDGPTTRRGWSEQKVFVTPSDGSRDTAFEIKLAKPEGVSFIRRMVWAADNRSLILDRVDKDTKRRQLFYIHNAGAKDEQIITIADETDDKWHASLSSIIEANPKDPSQLFFGSEKDGYSHLYLASLKKQAPESNPTGIIRQENQSDPGYATTPDIRQITKGRWQVEWAKWKSDGGHIIYSSTEGNTAERTFYDLSMPEATERGIAAEVGGMRTGPQMNEIGEPMLLFSYSRWNRPDELLVQHACVDCDGINFSRPLTETTPTYFINRKWNEPKFIDIPSRDGKQIKSKIYLPAGHNTKQKYPMVIFVHGAGYLQNVINGWNNYYREFMFNELLTQKGYVVLDIDYRGSAGYGRDWRTDVYDFLGGKDYDDHIDSIDFMIKNYGVDAKKVGVYGGSYGGFMAEMLAFRNPEKIAAAAALRPVADWKNYYASSPVYTAQRLGFPDKNPAAYKRSSPISYADGLKTQLLILHGMSDDNVHVQDSVQLIEKLIRLNKTEYFQAMLYPSENHGFVRPESWTDEYSRILAFFEKNLK